MSSPPPAECHFPVITASEAINQLRDKWVVFMGESTLRQIFLQFLGVIQSEPWDRIPDQKGERRIEERLAGSRFTFQYLEYYGNLSHELSGGAPTLYDGRTPDLLILNDGLHDLLYGHEQMAKRWESLTKTLTQFKQQHPEVPMMWVPSAQIHDDHLTKHRKVRLQTRMLSDHFEPRCSSCFVLPQDAEWFTNDSVYTSAIKPQRAFYETHQGVDYFYDSFRNLSFSKWQFDGIHNMERARLEAEGTFPLHTLSLSVLRSFLSF